MNKKGTKFLSETETKILNYHARETTFERIYVYNSTTFHNKTFLKGFFYQLVTCYLLLFFALVIVIFVTGQRHQDKCSEDHFHTDQENG